ncbi:MAG: hypothetical protein IT235_06010 [Bacteroidia bacterium]|nr:hypothetical protein [Bacteroidia bacterium]
MNYPKEAIENLTKYIDTNDTLAFNFLIQHNYKELTLLKEGVSRDLKCLEWLLVNKHFILAAFINAVWEDAKAFDLLLQKKAFHWAAAANIINGDENAILFLKKANLEHYINMALKMQSKIRREGDEGMNIFKLGTPSPYK